MGIGKKIVAMCGAVMLLVGMSGVARGAENAVEILASRSEAHTPEIGYAVVRGISGEARGVFYEKVDGLAILEGDIILGTVEELEGTEDTHTSDDIARGVAISGEVYRWPGGVLPYELDANLPSSTRDKIAAAMAHWEAQTVIRFVARTASNQQTYPDYVRFVHEDDRCAAMIGRRSGGQKIWLSERCATGSVIHEIGHALGLFHEQSREDRDRFVRVQWENIEPEMQHNFEKHVVDGDDISPYNYDSIMHYPPYAFSKNGLPTIEPLDPNVQIGQRNGLSQGDIDTIHTLYGEAPPDCQNGQVYKGKITSTDEVAWEPNNEPYASPAGTHEGRLEGPSNADFDLYLFYWTGTSWTGVASSTQATSSEAITYSGEAGYYIWGIHSYDGSGSYDFCLKRP